MDSFVIGLCVVSVVQYEKRSTTAPLICAGGKQRRAENSHRAVPADPLFGRIQSVSRRSDALIIFIYILLFSSLLYLIQLLILRLLIPKKLFKINGKKINYYR